MKRILMWAYGSNISTNRMLHRIPSAKKLGKLIVHNKALVFRGTADVEDRPGATVPGVLWEISNTESRRLDIHEGVGNGVYGRAWLRIMLAGETRHVLYYRMQHQGVMPPAESYLEIILAGYRENGLDESLLEAAVSESWHNKDKTDWLRDRHARHGASPMALPINAPVQDRFVRNRKGHTSSVGDGRAVVQWDDGTSGLIPSTQLQVLPYKEGA